MSHNKRVTRLLTGASLAALSFLGARGSAAAFTHNGVGVTFTSSAGTSLSINTDFRWVNLETHHFVTVTNNADIDDGFGNGGAEAVAVWVTTNATVDHFINIGTISAVEGTVVGNNFSTNYATATGMRIKGGVPLLTNDGSIRGLAFAHSTDSRLQNA